MCSSDLEGDLAFEKRTTEITLDSGETLTVDLLALGANGLSAFVGMNGGTPDQIGLALTDVGLGLALLSEDDGAERTWTSVQASAGGVAFVGMDQLTVSATSLDVKLNMEAADGSVVDYTDATDLTIATGPASTLTFDMAGEDGALIEAAGHLSLDVFGFFRVEGDLAFTSKAHQTVLLSDGREIDTKLLSVGGSNLEAFAGLNGGTDEAIGLSLGEVNFALALITDRAEPTHRYVSLQASAGLAEFIGVDDLTVRAEELAVHLNQGVAMAAQAATTASTNTWRRRMSSFLIDRKSTRLNSSHT